jgi:hypothetical protein
VIYRGRRYVVCGWDPMSVPDPRVQLEDIETQQQVRVPLDEVEPVPCCVDT